MLSVGAPGTAVARSRGRLQAQPAGRPQPPASLPRSSGSSSAMAWALAPRCAQPAAAPGRPRSGSAMRLPFAPLSARPALSASAQQGTAPHQAQGSAPLCVQQARTVAALPLLLRATGVVSAIALWGAVCSLLGGGSTAGSSLASMTLAAPTGVKTAVRSVWTGLAAGVLHTLAGPDHLAALTPLTIGRDRVAASVLGALWGLGHSTGQLILGLALVLLKDRFHSLLPALERWSGAVVACTLVAIGALGIWEGFLERHVGGRPEAPTVHADEEQRAVQVALAGANGAQASLKASFATYATGIVYGLQPDALFVVVPALALPTKAAAIAYCTTFVIGTVMAMGGYTLLIGHTSSALMREQPWLQAHLSTITSGIAIVIGVLIGLSSLGVAVPFF